MKVETGYESRTGRIEIVALIDVVFLLLILFIYATLSSSVIEGLDVDLPGGTGRSVESALIVTLDRDGNLHFQGRSGVLTDMVGWIATASTGESLVIRGDRRADLGVAIELLDRLRRMGVSRVSFEVEAEQ